MEQNFKSKWWAGMVAKHGSEQAVRDFMAGAARQQKNKGNGGFAAMKKQNPDKLKEISLKGASARWDKTNE